MKKLRLDELKPECDLSTLDGRVLESSYTFAQTAQGCLYDARRELSNDPPDETQIRNAGWLYESAVRFGERTLEMLRDYFSSKRNPQQAEILNWALDVTNKANTELLDLSQYK